MKEFLSKKAKKVTIAIIGFLVVVTGLIMVPYPGPGWLVVFLGLAILGSEFEFAQKILDKAHEKYENWKTWLKKQSKFIQLLVLLATIIVTVLTIWILNGYGILLGLFDIQIDWLSSPLFK